MLAYHRRGQEFRIRDAVIYEWTTHVAQGTHILDRGRPGQARIPRRAFVLLLVIAAITLGGAYYLASAVRSPAASAPTAAELRVPRARATVVHGTPAALSAAVAGRLFASDPVVVLTGQTGTAELALAAHDAAEQSAPLLLATAPGAAVSPAVRAEILRLHASYLLAVGLSTHGLAAELPGVSVVTSTTPLPVITVPAPLRGVALLVHEAGAGVAMPPAALAAIATAHAAGVQVIKMHGFDPRASSATIKALAAAKPQHVLAIGAGFGTAGSLAAKVTVAETGVQLPGGGQVLFPSHRLVAMYGSPGTPALGALGEQGLAASIARIHHLAGPYRTLGRAHVIPAFEILATVAQGSAGRNGLYSYESSVASLRPWVQRAIKDGLYVILDLQPGRANLLTQAKLYASLLKLPDVGLALDPEWKLQPGQLPLQQIGSVNISEVNSVVTWLAALTARYHLPQKLLVIHQFRLASIQDESRLDTHHQDLAIVIHMDGQGSPAAKVATWEAVVAAAPRGVFFGWKNFFVKDHPMMNPEETMDRRPQPVMISYQ
jgi:phosphoribosylcarboxyaminoimidazole (NCAIR) mutase